ncbi:MAG: O-antigen ligase family protein, partial [Anaerolineae bacterium]|nr:O-antigen ligase family protein [Anaerolineae bacterium]
MQVIIRIEWVYLAVMGILFWLPSPKRDEFQWLLLGIPLFLVARLIAHRRLGTWTPVIGALLALIALCLINIQTAPFTRGFIMLSRPLMILVIASNLTETAKIYRKLNILITASLTLSLLIGLLALTMSQWTTKSDQMIGIINLLPALRGFWGAEGGFNVNEIAGALVWITPLTSALAIYRWPRRLPATIFVLAFTALFLGQSRLALIGMFLGAIVIIVMMIPGKRNRTIAWMVLCLFCVLEILIIGNVFIPQNRTSSLTRDESSMTSRIAIWQSGLAIIKDFPLTGVGMGYFRYQPVRERYPVPGYETKILPHAHNEWVGIGTDLGLPGIAVFAGIYLTAGYMLVYGWRHGDPIGKAVAVGVGAGLLAH